MEEENWIPIMPQISDPTLCKVKADGRASLQSHPASATQATASISKGADESTASDDRTFSRKTLIIIACILVLIAIVIIVYIMFFKDKGDTAAAAVAPGPSTAPRPKAPAEVKKHVHKENLSSVGDTELDNIIKGGNVLPKTTTNAASPSNVTLYKQTPEPSTMSFNEAESDNNKETTNDIFEETATAALDAIQDEETASVLSSASATAINSTIDSTAPRCNGQTLQGRPCSRRASANGRCGQHNK
jgi:flagellar basal body-associated protein FliL